MITTAPQSPAGELYAQRIDELRAEIRHAMVAISGNQLHALEESLWRQEVLCTGLKHLLHAAGQTLQNAPSSPRLQASLEALQQVKRSYAELLRQAQASNHLLHALCRSYAGSGASSKLATPLCSLEA